MIGSTSIRFFYGTFFHKTQKERQIKVVIFMSDVESQVWSVHGVLCNAPVRVVFTAVVLV